MRFKLRFNLAQIWIFLIIVFSPLYVVRFKLLGLPTTLLEILIMIGFLLFLFDKMRNQGLHIFELLPRTQFDLPILFLLFSAVIALFATSDLREGLGIFKAYFLEPVVFYYLVVSLFSSGKKVFPLIFSLSLAAFWLSFLALLQAITGRFSLAPWELAQGRVTAVYNSANALALFLGPLFSLLLALIILGREKLLKDAAWFFVFSFELFLMAVVLVLSRSRGAMIAVFFVILSIFYFSIVKISSFKRLALRGLVLLFTILLFVLLLLFQVKGDLTPSIKSAGYSGSDTLQLRFYLWEGTLGLLQDRPFFGAGLDAFKELYSLHYLLPQYREPLQYPHNFFLTVWSELGVLGILAFAFLFWRILTVLDKLAVWGKSLLCAFIYLFIHGLVDVPFFKNDLALEFFLFLAFAQILSSRENFG